MATTYEKIATTTLGSANSVISFGSIGSGYTDLRLVFVATSTSATPSIPITFNSDTGANYSFTYLYGNGSSAASGANTSQNNIYAAIGSGLSSTIPTMITLDIFSYAGSTFKTCLLEGSFDKNGSGTTERFVGLWRSTSAINTITLTTSTSTFATGTTATLYGILKA
jgi:hypothetical protein